MECKEQIQSATAPSKAVDTSLLQYYAIFTPKHTVIVEKYPFSIAVLVCQRFRAPVLVDGSCILKRLCTRALTGLCCALVLSSASAQSAQSAQTPLVTPERESLQRLELANLTRPELQSYIHEGFTTVILPTGGTEQGGTHMALGKHNFIVQQSAERIAAKLGRVLVAPALPFVPEGALDRPTGNLLYPGTLGLSEGTFANVLIDVCTSLYLSGFKLIVLMGDHGQSMGVQGLVAENLSKAWAQQGVRVINLSAYNDPALEQRVLERAGIAKRDWGEHGGVADTAELWFVRPQAIRPEALRAQASTPSNVPTGASGRPELASPQMGEEMMAQRVNAGAEQLRGYMLGADHE